MTDNTERKTDTGLLLKKIHDLMEKQANRALKDMDLTFSQHHVLIFLEHCENGEASLKEAEKQFRVAQSTMAGLARRLEEKGLVQSYYDDADRRIKMIRLSEEGRRLCRRSRRDFDEKQTMLTKGLKKNEQAELHRMLETVYQNLQASETE